jgi:transcriptional regulator with XRE-family HTH domain
VTGDSLRELGEAVTRASKAAGLNQTQLAAAAGTSRGFVQQLMRGDRFDGKPFDPKPGSVLAVIEALNDAATRAAGQDCIVIPPAYALRLAGVSDGELDRYLTRSTGRPNITAARIAEQASKLTSRQREAVVDVIESMLWPTRQDETAETETGDEPVHVVVHEERPRGVPGPVVEHVAHEEPARD